MGDDTDRPMVDDGARFRWALGAQFDSSFPPRLQQLPDFDNETFIRAMGLSEEGVCVLWRR